MTSSVLPVVALGAASWLAAPFLPVGSAPAFAGIEHLFLVVPLVAVPLALTLVSRTTGTSYGRAALVQPITAAMVTTSFFVERGPVAGALAVPWLAMGIVLGVRGAGAALHARGIARVSALAAHAFLPIGSLWLVLARVGAGPASVSQATVLHAAVHFHVSGFVLQILFVATMRLTGSRLLRVAAVTAVAGIPLIAAGNLLATASVRLLGVAAMVVATTGLAAVTFGTASHVAPRAAKVFLRVAATSLAFAMLTAAIHGAGELRGGAGLPVQVMVLLHGLVNALGFVVCGLVGHLAVTEVEIPGAP